MKRIIFLLLIVISLCSCYEEVDNFFQGKHELLYLNFFHNEYMVKNKQSSGGFVLIAGGYSSRENEVLIREHKYIFYWKTSTGEYIRCEIDAGKVALKLIKDKETMPYVTFPNYKRLCCSVDINYYVHRIHKAVLHIRQSDIVNAGEMNIELR